jgi:hypothetical protein
MEGLGKLKKSTSSGRNQVKGRKHHDLTGQ